MKICVHTKMGGSCLGTQVRIKDFKIKKINKQTKNKHVIYNKDKYMIKNKYNIADMWN